MSEANDFRNMTITAADPSNIDVLIQARTAIGKYNLKWRIPDNLSGQEILDIKNNYIARGLTVVQTTEVDRMCPTSSITYYPVLYFCWT